MKTVRINTFDEYLKYIEPYKGEYLFRGQANSNWDITPSLFRNDTEQEAKYISNNLSDKIDEDIIINLFRMQHFGVPTRLIDLTISPYSALLFATELENEQQHDGVVYVFKTRRIIKSKDIRLTKFCELLLNDDLKSNCPEELLEFATEDHIIEYRYNYSYSNPRARIQGGTSLLIGLGYDGNNLYREKNVNIDGLIVEKIIIPQESKADIVKKLRMFGYFSDVIYNNWDDVHNNTKFQLIRTKFEVYNKAFFVKIVAHYKISSLEFNWDVLVDKIVELYDSFFLKYGNNSRIWLFFYYDQNDIDRANWICRTEWKEGDIWEIDRNKDYYSTRLLYINEEVSFDKAYKEIYPLLKDSQKLFTDVIEASQRDIKTFCKLINQRKKDAENIFLRSGNIPHVEVEKEPFFRASFKYINCVESLYLETSLYIDRNESEKFIRYWFRVLTKECTDTIRELKDICQELKIKKHGLFK